MLELDRQSCLLSHFNPRTEMHGEEKEPAADLKLSLRTSNDVLAEFHPSLKSAFYREPDRTDDLADQGMDKHALTVLRFPKLSGWSYDTEIVGCTLTLHYGTGGKSDIVLPGATADRFAFELLDGGLVNMTFRVRCHPDEKQAGKIYTLQQQEVEITLEPPAADEQLHLKDAA